MTGPVDRRAGPGGGQVYAWPGPDPAPFTVPSVTTIVGAVTPAAGLVTWAAKIVATAATADVAALATAVAANRDKATKQLAGAADRVRDDAGALGTRVHNVIAAGAAPEDVDDELAGYVRAWRGWLERSGARVLESERTIWAPDAGYAGTFDALVELEGELLLVDFKSGRTLLPAKIALQLTGYACGEFVGEAGIVDRRAGELLRRVDGLAIVHLRPGELPDGLALYRFALDDAARRAWEAAVDLYGFYRRARLVAGDRPKEDNMDAHEVAAVAAFLEEAAAALRRIAAGTPPAPAFATAPTPIRQDAPAPGRLRAGDRHRPDHNELRAGNRGGLYCPTPLEGGGWCDFRQVA